MRIISDAEVQTTILPRLSLSSLLHSQALAFQSLRPSSSANRTIAQCPLRLSLRTPSHTQLFMPARTHTPNSVVKIVSVPTPNSAAGSGIPGVNLLFDDLTGRLSHVVNSTCLTALRTAAGSLASSVLALGAARGEVRSAVVFGDGAQAVMHVWLHQRYFGALTEVCVVVGSHRQLCADEVLDKGKRFAAQLEALPSPSRCSVKCISGQDRNAVQEALGDASLVFTCTPSTHPLFDHTDLTPSKRTHICAVGSYTPSMCELPASLVRAASSITGALVVDSIDACVAEAGCLLQALPSVDELRTRCVELGGVLPPADGEEEGYLERVERQAVEYGMGEAGVTLFKSVGVGVQDVEITKLVVAVAGDVGAEVAF
ncbi:uncharacterized protein SRS1_15811 [Sporisorium reilianum f. sp. reilianum]|uniref:Ornithine cyclodeaminase n=1 Tax=Sporisorium reilianum f. sp. reilianum TaxID=72559 RepID=A0A2N8UKI0_9BASI|nr:uncharacterized protein SRS1_15811 [Sporisorium reilianum f. sp. reilianum]